MDRIEGEEPYTMSIAAPERPAKQQQRKPVDAYRTFGWCTGATNAATADGREYHDNCPGSSENGRVGDAHLMAYCDCGCHADVPVCRDCRQRDVELTLTGTCVDVEACEGVIARKQAANPVWQMLQTLQSESQQRAEATKAQRAQAREAQRQADIAAGREPATPVRRERKAPPIPQRCHCGCGGMTKGGRFVAGHDARLKGVLVRAARQTDDPASTRTAAVRAMAELTARDWPRKHVDTAITRDADALVEQYGPDKIIESALSTRYPEVTG